ncbi:DUF6573 family protein [Streptomyces marincola]|uniref:DUF6573 family protein n=1 Tax=Streptomyces marincola TaxID=2878388 RepID=UPI001CF37FB2|nr:DUF6573 family protein [Streptomyces marincola]UCM88024.1 hypothetical protein LC193_08680 [Streptomyces marincola]
MTHSPSPENGESQQAAEIGADAMRRMPERPGGSRGPVRLHPIFGISAHSRAEAIEDGVLVPVDEGIAREAGFGVPLALTAAAYEDCVAWSDEDNERKGMYQDEAGRLWDVLTMVRVAVRRAGGRGRRCVVEVHRVPRSGLVRAARHTRLVAQIGPGDAGELVMTVMRPYED